MKDRTSRGWHIVLSAALITLAVGSLLPLAVTFLTSIKRGRDLFDPLSTDFQPTLDNYRRVFQEVGIGFYMSNSLIVALASVVATLVLALLAAYGLCRMRMRGERTIALAMLCLRTVPAIALVLPYFLMAQFLGIVDTKVLLVIAHMTFGLPLAIWLLRGFMRELPAELDEAAKVDGAGHLMILARVILPNMKPGIAAASILLFIHSWNDYVFANVLTSTDSATFPTTMNFFMGINTVAYGEMAAAAIVGTTPILVLAAVFHRSLVSGFARGAV